MHPILRACRDELGARIDALSAERAERDRNGRWSVAAILEHLDLTYARSTEGIERRLQQGAPPAYDASSVRQMVGRLLVLRLGYLPSGRRAPEGVLPVGRPYLEVRAVIEMHLLLLDQRLTQAAAAFGARRPLTKHPFLGPLAANDWRRFHLVHTRHHLKQIDALV